MLVVTVAIEACHGEGGGVVEAAHILLGDALGALVRPDGALLQHPTVRRHAQLSS